MLASVYSDVFSTKENIILICVLIGFIICVYYSPKILYFIGKFIDRSNKNKRD